MNDSFIKKNWTTSTKKHSYTRLQQWNFHLYTAIMDANHGFRFLNISRILFTSCVSNEIVRVFVPFCLFHSFVVGFFTRKSPWTWYIIYLLWLWSCEFVFTSLVLACDFFQCFFPSRNIPKIDMCFSPPNNNCATVTTSHHALHFAKSSFFFLSLKLKRDIYVIFMCMHSTCMYVWQCKPTSFLDTRIHEHEWIEIGWISFRWVFDDKASKF